MFWTVQGVEERDGFLYAPGIGDDTRALAMLLCIIRALNKTGIRTEGDIVFVGTTREEGMGGLGGMKDLPGRLPPLHGRYCLSIWQAPPGSWSEN